MVRRLDDDKVVSFQRQTEAGLEALLVVLQQTFVIINGIVRVIVLFMTKVEIISTTNDKVVTFQQHTKGEPSS